MVGKISSVDVDKVVETSLVVMDTVCSVGAETVVSSVVLVPMDGDEPVAVDSSTDTACVVITELVTSGNLVVMGAGPRVVRTRVV